MFSGFHVVDGPLDIDQPPAMVFASHTRSQHLPQVAQLEQPERA